MIDARPSTYLEDARKYDPEGITCGFCGGVNEFCDDCGFFWVTDPKDGGYKPTCNGHNCPKSKTAER